MITQIKVPFVDVLGHPAEVVGLLANGIVYLAGNRAGGWGYCVYYDNKHLTFYSGKHYSEFAGYRKAMRSVVKKAKALGATKVIFDDPWVDKILGLPVEGLKEIVNGGIRISDNASPA